MIRNAALATVLLATACASAVGTSPTATPQPTAPPTMTAHPTSREGAASTVRDTHELLQAALWMQTSAEYRVLCEAIYRDATAALAAALAEPAWSAATEQAGDPSALPPAVVLDLDETVLDNSRYEGEVVLRRAGYSPALWREWVALRKAGLVPGAGGFLAAARERGVAVVFITNRRLEEEADTVANLAALGVPTTAADVLCIGENNWTSDKTARRSEVASTHRILLLVGDDLGDFMPARLSPERRVEEAEKRASWWGERWFMLPNPVYGSWERALWNHEPRLTDRDTLSRKFARVKGFAD